MKSIHNIIHIQAELYKEDFKSERHDREVAHGKIADHEKKYAQDVGELKAELAQMEENLHQHKERLADVEQLYQRKERETRSFLEEASKNQQEVQAKTSQVKQYKKQVDTLKAQVCFYICFHDTIGRQINIVVLYLKEIMHGNNFRKAPKS